MKEITADTELVSFCGLYCGSCKRYLADKCPGCSKNEKAAWCKTRKCCLEKGLKSCADCQEVKDFADCKLLDNFIAKIFGFVFRTDRISSLRMIKDNGYEEFVEKMVAEKRVAIKR